MQETLKFISIKKKIRGNKFHVEPNIHNIKIYQIISDNLVEHDVTKRRVINKYAILEDGTLLAIEYKQKTHKPNLAAPVIAETETEINPNLEKFKAAFGTLKDLKVFGGDSVQFQREMRDEWQ